VGKVALDSEWGRDNSMHFCLNGHKRRQEMHPDEPISNSAPVQKHVAEEVVVKQVEERLKENHAGTCTDGDSGEDCVSITLIWDQAGGAWDLDLWVTDPSGELIKFNHRTSASGGKLDTDKIESDDDPVENIIWKHDAPKGEYVVQVHPFAAGGKGKKLQGSNHASRRTRNPPRDDGGRRKSVPASCQGCEEVHQLSRAARVL